MTTKTEKAIIEREKRTQKANKARTEKPEAKPADKAS
jgi:hypothetical protein